MLAWSCSPSVSNRSIDVSGSVSVVSLIHLGSRRLLTYRKLKSAEPDSLLPSRPSERMTGIHADELNNFRKRVGIRSVLEVTANQAQYFQGFKTADIP